MRRFSPIASETRYQIQQRHDFASLQEIQLEILGSVCQTLRKGGIITIVPAIVARGELSGLFKHFPRKSPRVRAG